MGFCALLLGIVPYVFRTPGSSHLGKVVVTVVGDLSFKADIFGVVGGVLPELLHPFAFILLTVCLLPETGRKTRGIICVFWLAVEILFEVGQYSGYQTALYLDKVLPSGEICDALKNYFQYGTYDTLDIVAIFLGTTAGYFVSNLTGQGGTQIELDTCKQGKSDWSNKEWQWPVLGTDG